MSLLFFCLIDYVNDKKWFYLEILNGILYYIDF